MADDPNSDDTVSFISDQLEEFFQDVGVDFSPVAAGVGIVLGLFIAFLGSKGQGTKLLAFVSGTLLGLYGAGLILAAADPNQELENEVWVGIFFSVGLLVGILTVIIVKFAPLIIGISTGIIISAALFQVGVAQIGNNIALLAIGIVIVIITTYLACKVLDFVFAILAAFLGGSMFTLGLGHFLESPITLNLLLTDPASSLDECVDESCYIPLAIGGAVTVVALLWNLRLYRKKRKKKKQNAEAKEENGKLIAQMKEDRTALEAKFAALEKQNKELLVTLEKNAAGREKTILSGFQKEVKKQEAETAKKVAALEKQLKSQQKHNLEKDVEKDILIKELETEKLQLELQMKEEKEEELKLDSLLNAQLTVEEKEQKKLDEKEEKDRKQMILDLQKEAVESKLRLENLEKDFKEAALIEKRLNVPSPKVLKKRRPKYFDDDEDLKREIEELEEMRLRAEEFAKMKALVHRCKNAQRDVIKRLKKGFKEIEKLNNGMRKLSMKQITNAQSTLKKEKEHALEDMTLKMTVLRTLLNTYEGMNAEFVELTNEMEAKFTEFREAEKKIEERAILNEKKLEKIQAEAATAAAAAQAARKSIDLTKASKHKRQSRRLVDTKQLKKTTAVGAVAGAAAVAATVPEKTTPTEDDTAGKEKVVKEPVEVQKKLPAEVAEPLVPYVPPAMDHLDFDPDSLPSTKVRHVSVDILKDDEDDPENLRESLHMVTGVQMPVELDESVGEPDEQLTEEVTEQVRNSPADLEEGMARQVTAAELIDELPPPREFIYRDNYFASEPRMTIPELNSYFIKYMRKKYPKLMSYFDNAGRKIKTTVQSSYRSSVQSIRRRAESMRSSRFNSQRQSSIPVDAEVVASPHSMPPSPSANMLQVPVPQPQTTDTDDNEGEVGAPIDGLL